MNMELVYKRKKDPLPIECYVDSDWATEVHDRKSVTGYLIKIFENTVS